jgi:hypothetical protein
METSLHAIMSSSWKHYALKIMTNLKTFRENQGKDVSSGMDNDWGKNVP